jgi:hypothetical protein
MKTNVAVLEFPVRFSNELGLDFYTFFTESKT